MPPTPDTPGATTPAGEATQGAVVLPKPIDVGARYPEGASGRAEVVLELVVDNDGRVAQSWIVSGEPPFADAALAAAQGWRFEPASRDGQKVSARIRYTLTFEPAPGEADAAAPGVDAGAAPVHVEGAPARVEAVAEPIEVVVRGKTQVPGAVTVTREEARDLPGTFGDPVRAIEAQPGVVPIISGVPSFFIRGAPPANVGFFIDGVDVPLLFHAFFGPSVLHPAFIESIDFYRGVSPAQYGRFAGPIVEANLKPFEHRIGGEGAVRSIDVGGFAEVPLGACDEGKGPDCAGGGVRAAGRYSYAGLILSLLSDARLDYWDYQGQFEYKLGPHDTVGVLAFGGYDFFRSSREPIANQGAKVEFHRFDLRWDRRLPSDTSLRVALTGGSDRSAGSDAPASSVSDHSLRGRVEFSTRLGAAATLQAGFDARVDRYDLETQPLSLTYPDYSVLFPARTEWIVGAYVSTELRPEERITIIPAVRADRYAVSGKTAVGVDPRITAVFAIGDDVTIEPAIGLSHQEANFAAQIPGAKIADLEGGLESAILASSGVRWVLPASVSASFAVFRNVYYNVLDPVGGARDFNINRTVLDRRSTISAYGLEVGLTRAMTRKLGGMISYTLSHSDQTMPHRSQVSGFDRPHVLQAALSYDFGSGIRAGARGVFYSGVPELNLEGTPHLSSERRGPPYFRLDLRFEKLWRFGPYAYFGLLAEVLNATSTREAIRLDCGTLCVERFAGPVILPSVGVEAGF